MDEKKKWLLLKSFGTDGCWIVVGDVAAARDTIRRATQHVEQDLYAMLDDPQSEPVPIEFKVEEMTDAEIAALPEM